MSSPKSPKSALSKIGLGRPRPLRILVLGQSGVGKSALVVRYITRRYIGEYDPCLERIYPHMAVIDGETLALEILDSAGQSHETDSVRLEANIRWADVFVLMYSVTDKCSFDDCNRLKFLINYNKRKRRIPSPTSKVSWVFEDTVRYWREVVKTPKLRRASSDLHDLPTEPHKAVHPPGSVPGSPVLSRSYATRAAHRFSIRARTHPVSRSLTPLHPL
ncbi:hypothetical protein OTU49_010421 [Cherax quadricarinatus]|uniref:small monomeric GTPase n=1 Tax=Cherax quadricarinatus TaxID=27406 RepID=A0AAW0W8F7_CHEQU